MRLIQAESVLHQPQSRDYEEVIVDATPVQLTPSKIVNKSFAVIRAEDGPMRFRSDGEDASATVGIPLFDGDQLEIIARELDRFSVVRTGTTNGLLRVMYFGLLFLSLALPVYGQASKPLNLKDDFGLNQCQANLAATGQYVLVLRETRDNAEQEMARLRQRVIELEAQVKNLTAQKLKEE